MLSNSHIEMSTWWVLSTVHENISFRICRPNAPKLVRAILRAARVSVVDFFCRCFFHLFWCRSVFVSFVYLFRKYLSLLRSINTTRMADDLLKVIRHSFWKTSDSWDFEYLHQPLCFLILVFLAPETLPYALLIPCLVSDVLCHSAQVLPRQH